MNTLKHSEKVMKVSAQKAGIVKPKVWCLLRPIIFYITEFNPDRPTNAGRAAS